jgi:C1A family cysteine protease
LDLSIMKAAFLLATVAAAEPTFEEWKAMFGISTNAADDAVMRGKYNANVEKIQAMNAENNGATFAVNQFAAMDATEWSAYLTRSNASRDTSLPVLGVHSHDGSELATSIDWTSRGAVTAVKDQGSCGGCWSFAATGGLEGANSVASGRLVSLAEQQFLDCDTADSACNGGLEYNGWNYFKQQRQAICTESSYPYTARKGTCQQSSCTAGLAGGAITGVTHVQSGSASALQSALNSRPVAIGIEADQTAFQFYSSGILSGTCGTRLDHSVLAVGYDTTSGYWKVKNSWGSSWGESGYVRLSMSGDKCGILDDASFPVVTASVEV